MTPSEIGSGNWLPVELAGGADAGLATDVAVRWMDFGSEPLTEPFFDHTVKRLRSTSPPAREWDTGLEAILRAAIDLPPVKPAGFVFHISRCGSTLIANALKTAGGTQVVSESRVVAKLLMPCGPASSLYWQDRWNRKRLALLNSLFSLFAHYPDRQRQKLVIKMVSINLLCMPLVRAFWPDVPCVVVVRDPAEVMVASLESGGGWLSFREAPAIADRIFGFEKPAAEMSPEEYCARALGKFMRSALAAPAEECMVVDYEDLNERRIRQIANHFGLDMPSSSEKMDTVLRLYSKDPARRERFQDDRQEKRRRASPEIRAAASRWAMPAYCDLRAH